MSSTCSQKTVSLHPETMPGDRSLRDLSLSLGSGVQSGYREDFSSGEGRGSGLPSQDLRRPLNVSPEGKASCPLGLTPEAARQEKGGGGGSFRWGRSHTVAQAGLESRPSCLSLPSVGIVEGMPPCLSERWGTSRAGATQAQAESNLASPLRLLELSLSCLLYTLEKQPPA